VTEAGQQHVLYVRMRDAGDFVPRNSSARPHDGRGFHLLAARAARGRREDRLRPHHRVQIRSTTRSSIDSSATSATSPAACWTRGVCIVSGSESRGAEPGGTERGQAERAVAVCDAPVELQLHPGRGERLWSPSTRPTPGGRDRQDPLVDLLECGGKLFLFGGRPISAIISTATGGRAATIRRSAQAGASLQNFSDESFIWRSSRSQSGRRHRRLWLLEPAPYDHQTWRDGLIRCISQNPPIRTCTSIPRDTTRRGWPTAAAETADAASGITRGPLRQDLRALFPSPDSTRSTPRSATAGPAVPELLGRAVIAQRYQSTKADTLSGVAQGRVVLFLFQPYPFYEGPAVDAGTAAVTWLIKVVTTRNRPRFGRTRG